MAQHLIFHNIDGTVTLVDTAPGCKYTLTQLAAQLRRGRAYDIIDTSNIPVDSTFRNAWKPGVGKIDVDMPLAKGIAHVTRRSVRAKKFAPLDIEATIPAQAVEAEVSRQTIRDEDAVLQINLDAAVNPAGLKALMVEGGLA